MTRQPEAPAAEDGSDAEPDRDRQGATVPAPSELGSVRRGRLGRRVFAAGLVAFLGLGVLGFYGVRTRQVSAVGGGYELTVVYTSVTRPGLATPWSVEVRRAGGFGDELVSVAVTAAYFDVFDENGLDPDPAEATNDGERTIWRFLPPPGDTLTVTFDARLEPSVQLTVAEGRATVLDAAGGDAVAVSFRTWVLP